MVFKIVKRHNLSQIWWMCLRSRGHYDTWWKKQMDYSHIIYHLTQLFVFDTWHIFCVTCPLPSNPYLPIPFPTVQTFKQLSELPYFTINTLSQQCCFPTVCIRKCFLLLSAKTKKHIFSWGQMLKADTYSLIHPLNYGKWVSLCTWTRLNTQEEANVWKCHFHLSV